MKITKTAATLVLAAAILAPFAGIAADSKTDKPASTYPLTTCVVSGEKLGEMDKPYVFTQDGKQVQLCCKGCLKDFKKDPAKYLKKIEDAEKAAKK